MIGIFGGTFDPVHNGHIHAALSVLEALGLTKVHMMLSARPGHRAPAQTLTTHRWEMLKLACANYGALQADDREVCREGISFTFDTLQEIAREDTAAKNRLFPAWILGQDSYATLPAWHRWEEMLDLCNLVVLDRPGQLTPEPDALLQFAMPKQCEKINPTKAGQMLRLSLPMLNISSTYVREQKHLGTAMAEFLLPEVDQYIKKHKLYNKTEGTA